MSANIDHSSGKVGSAPSDASHEALARFSVAAGDSESNEVAIVQAPCDKMKKVGKTLLDNMPGLINIAFIWATGSFATYFLCWCSVAIGLVALVVDAFHCRRRWASGLEAVFPKMITVTYVVMNAVILGLLYGGVLKVDIVYIINGCFIVGGLFIASSLSLLIRRPWLYAMAVEFMPPERLEAVRRSPEGVAAFKEIMTAITAVVTLIFFTMFCINLACTIWKVYGGRQDATQITNMVANAAVFTFAIKFVMPRVIGPLREKARERVAAV